MATICNKPKGSCQNCVHYRYDGDQRKFFCFAAKDYESLFGFSRLVEVPKTETVVIFEIDWDYDIDEEIEMELPDEIEIDISSLKKVGKAFNEDSIGDYLADEYGFCVNSYKVKMKNLL